MVACPAQRRLSLIILTVLLCLCGNRARSAMPWFARVWQVDDGLPGDNVTGVAQTRDGYLWVATQSGLARFDGVRIQNIQAVSYTHLTLPTNREV